jgi:nucleoside-diphosphate-sugar epimerase
VTILVTGGSGLVGTHVLRALQERAGTRVRALVRRNSQSIVEEFGAEAVVGDVTDPAIWQRAAQGVSGIVHSAALVASPNTYDEYVRVNVGGTRLALEAARRERVALVHVSSVAVYGRDADQTAITEDFPFQPLPERDYYARAKRAAEELVQREASRDGLSAIAIRPNVIYGEHDTLFTARLVANLRRALVPQIGPGTNLLSCVYAGNVASAILAALDAPPSPGFRAYQVTRDAPPLLTQREFFTTLAEQLGLRPRFIRVPTSVVRLGIALWTGALRLVHPRRYAALAGSAVQFITGKNPCVIDRIVTELGWNPPFDTRTAIGRTVRWLERAR